MTFLKWIIGYFRYTPKGKQLYGQCGAIIIRGRAPWINAQRGVESQESGISVRRFAVRYFMEVNEKLPDNNGQCITRAFADRAAVEVTIEGEVTGTTGLMALIWGTALVAPSYVLVNDTDKWDSQPAQPNGWIFMDEVTETQERAGWRSINMRLSSFPENHA